MSGAPSGAVELLERALSYTRAALVGVVTADLSRPTPCAEWTLADLLAHMDDSLDAFVEAAGGEVHLPPTHAPALHARVASLQHKACHVLGRWSRPNAPPVVNVGGVSTPSEVVVAAAALEIALHGWDVASVTGGPDLPERFAADLTPLSEMLITDRDRGVRFGPVVAVRPDATPVDLLLAAAGRHRTGPVRAVSRVRRTKPPRTS